MRQDESRRTGAAALTAIAGSLLIALSALALSFPGSALSSSDESPAPEASATAAPSPAPTTTSPVLDALSYLPLEGNVRAFDFTDWTALKALHGGADITSASPLEQRQRLMLDIARSEASTFALGLDRLATWPERWGWDNTDLAWQASCCDAPFAILRFGEDWDPGPFIARLEEYGYVRSDKPHAISFTVGPDTDVPADADLERVLGLDGQFADVPLEYRASVAISSDGHTIVLVRGRDAHRILQVATRIDPAAVAESPFGRVATALGRPDAATIMDATYGCPSPVEGIDLLPDEAIDLAPSVGPLHQYRALGIGYERAGPGEPAVGRYVFAYKKSRQAQADLPGRRTLIDEGYSVLHGKRYRDAAFTLVDAVADGRELVLDVAPVDDRPGVLFDLLIGRSISFAMCG